jgi:hypothetical protein
MVNAYVFKWGDMTILLAVQEGLSIYLSFYLFIYIYIHCVAISDNCSGWLIIGCTTCMIHNSAISEFMALIFHVILIEQKPN